MCVCVTEQKALKEDSTDLAPSSASPSSSSFSFFSFSRPKFDRPWMDEDRLRSKKMDREAAAASLQKNPLAVVVSSSTVLLVTSIKRSWKVKLLLNH